MMIYDNIHTANSIKKYIRYKKDKNTKKRLIYILTEKNGAKLHTCIPAT